MSHDDVESLIKILADSPPEALSYTKVLLRKQGVQATK